MESKCLNPAILQRVFRHWGSPHVDLFALKLNSELTTYLRAGGMESGQSSPVMDRPVCLCIPSNEPNQADSEETCHRQGRVNLDSTGVAKTGVILRTTQCQ